MEIQDKMTLEATGEFPFTFYIEKAVATEEEDEFILEGIASTTNLDHDSERMSESALRSMEAVINDVGVPLRVEHQKEDEAIIGKVYEARVDERNQLHVKARLDKNHPASPILYHSMKTGAKMGLSVGGLVKRAVRELSEKTGKMVKTFYDVALKEVSVTPRPANYDSWLVAKSIAEKGEDVERFRNTAIYREFLFENPQLDYLQAFAKSIPDGAWHKIASQDNTTYMTTEETKEKGETEGTTEKAVSRGEFTALAGLVTKGFESMTALLSKALNVEAHDQNGPDQDKPEQIGNEENTAKAEGDAMDQNNPDEKKPVVIGGQDNTAKTEANGTDENGTREKTSDEEEKEKAKKDTADDYKLETVERATKSMENLLARINKTETEEEKSKAEDDDKSTTKTSEEEDKEKAEDSRTEDETAKGIHPMDAFVAVVTKTMEAMMTKMEKSGMNIPGFEKHIINQLREDPELQSELAKMAKIPGFKKSVSMGVPYVATKDGRRFALTMTEAGAPIIEKSRGEEGQKSFKEVYQQNFSSVKEGQG